MGKPNRDLLVLLKQELMTPQALEHEVELLHQLLCQVEKLDNIIATHEILDLVRYRKITKDYRIRSILRKKYLKPFIFINCKN